MKSWDVIAADIRSLVEQSADPSASAALLGIEKVAHFIAQGPLGAALFGWTSMADLCIQQTDHAPYSTSHLRISAQPSGLIEFRYVDTAVADRQWSRIETPERAVERLTSFLQQLRWIADAIEYMPRP